MAGDEAAIAMDKPKPGGLSAELEQLVAESDTGGRSPAGMVGWALLAVAVFWSLFQLWYASPLPFLVGFLILNDTEARAIHLGFALFLAFTAYPAFKRSPRQRIPITDWVLAALGAFAGSYLFLFYDQLSTRPGQPTAFDLTVAAIGLPLLLEATRRSLGLPMVIVALTFIAFTFLGQQMPEVIQHRGASPQRFFLHQWLTTEGVFGVALGVSTSFVFLFVLFGSLLEKAGGGNWMMQLSLALLGHLRGGPAKVAVVSSALNGVISGSSVSNVVSGGIFTIPMMKRTGLSGVKAGAIEAASSINGQIMPPVMGAAAFLMVEYVGIPYAQIVKHAALPALISYLGLFYIVHLEALKIGAEPVRRAVERSFPQRLARLGLGWSGTILTIVAVYYGILAARALLGDVAGPVLLIAGLVVYLALIAYAARHPALEVDDPDTPLERLPEAWPVARTGLHYLIPLGVLLWCLMVEQLSPGLSAFWATLTIIGILITQRPLVALFRAGHGLGPATARGFLDLVEGLAFGARNMIGIAVATASAGIIVGTVTLTGLGLMMTDLVEYLSGGSVILMLLLTGVICLFLGMGIPTTANYILVATLMAPVVVDLGAQAGLAIPLIAVHLFVFYFGIMADVTPPVGLASFAAAAISGEDPIRTGLQASFYALRTAILPFLFIFSPQLLLIDVHGVGEALLVILVATAAMLLFAAASMGHWLTRSRWWESAALLVACLSLLNPNIWLDRLYPRFQEAPPEQLYAAAEAVPPGGRLVIRVEGLTLEGDEVVKTVSLRLDAPGPGKERLAAAGLTLLELGGSFQVADARFGSYARRAGLEPGLDVTGVLQPSPRPSRFWVWLPALVLAAAVALLQARRQERVPSGFPTRAA